MFLRKALISALCAICAVSLMIPTAFAHGGCHRGSNRSTVRPCAVESCTVMGYHYHSGTAYYGHTHGNGLCRGSCAPLCQVENCALTGRHYHNGSIYCGSDHAGGYCGGGCPYTYTQTSGSWNSRCGGHHGWHHGW